MKGQFGGIARHVLKYSVLILTDTVFTFYEHIRLYSRLYNWLCELCK